MARLKRLKKIRLHREGNTILWNSLIALLVTNGALYFLLKDSNLWPFYIYAAITVSLFAIAVNFFRCPIRLFPGDTENVVVASADGKIVVIEEVDENEYFHDRRLMISIFMSITNVHANWFPVDGFVKKVVHHKGNFHKAWLPKASTENERSTVVIETPAGQEILVRQVAGAWHGASSPMPAPTMPATSTSTWASSSSVRAWTCTCRSIPRCSWKWDRPPWATKPSWHASTPKPPTLRSSFYR